MAIELQELKSSTPDEAIDQSTIESLREMGGTEFLQQLLDIFLADMPVRMNDLDEAHRDSNSQLLSESAHSMKSSSANMGAMNLSKIYSHLETLGRQESTDGVAELVAAAHEEFELVGEALNAELQKD